jgi:hypothetical protein
VLGSYEGELQGSPLDKTIHAVVGGVVPSLGMFGIYRIWVGIIESWPDAFYHNDVATIPAAYQHVEPTYRHKHDLRPTPVVDLGSGVGLTNIGIGFMYVLLGFAPLALVWWRHSHQ